ncbi:MAG TPA: methyltransferase domain-containing protein [Chitinophagaceae bacterium]|nr:methyltransferase domain-containing protein [Chitinophagaceae bacterium]
MVNVNDTFFEGQYKEIWRAVTPAQLTDKEVAFLISYFDLKPGSRVLDFMCGYGRHALGLARQGVWVTAVDNLADYISEIEKTAAEEQLPVKAVQASVTEFIPESDFDLVICMGNSLNFFDKGTLQSLLSRLAAAIRQGGALLIHTWSLTETVVKEFVPRSWAAFGDTKILTEARYLLRPARIESTTTIISPEGIIETREGVDYIFSLAEMEDMLQDAGFFLKAAYTVPGRKEFEPGDSRAYLIAQKK